MPELNLMHIEQISLDISHEEIVFSHLKHDLIDHICCDVEEEMKSGLNFHDAYQKVKEKMGYRRLREIQEESLYLVDTKYRNMKQTMKISGMAGSITFGLAALFKIQHWPGSTIMLTIGALILACVFLPSALGILWKETHSKNKVVLLISGFMAGFFFISGTLLKVQHWPFAAITLSLSFIICVFMFIPALLSNRLSGQESRGKKAVYILGAAGIIFFITGMLFKIQHWPLATILIVIGLITLSVVVLPFYTWLNWRQESHITTAFLFLVIGAVSIIVPAVLINLNYQNSKGNEIHSHIMKGDLKDSATILNNTKHNRSLN